MNNNNNKQKRMTFYLSEQIQLENPTRAESSLNKSSKGLVNQRPVILKKE